MFINRIDTSISRSKQLEAAVPPSRISALSSGEFVGMVADNPDSKIELKAFYYEIINNHAALKKEIDGYVSSPVSTKDQQHYRGAELFTDQAGYPGYYRIGTGAVTERPGTVTPHR